MTYQAQVKDTFRIISKMLREAFGYLVTLLLLAVLVGTAVAFMEVSSWTFIEAFRVTISIGCIMIIGGGYMIGCMCLAVTAFDRNAPSHRGVNHIGGWLGVIGFLSPLTLYLL
ncbi:MAG: hypothetical protein VX730_06610 [Pseudomonadota bacterium]|nr:hypothetical protein [Pseudomonadota bacterium]